MAPTRELRQGNPLSPYLFILGREVLARLINKAVCNGAINGGKLGCTSLSITKLVYANDVILIFKAKQAGLSAMAECLSKYCASSSQNIAVEKSRLSSSHGVHSQFLTQIWNQRGLKLLPRGEKYLGVPLLFSRSKKERFCLSKGKQ